MDPHWSEHPVWRIPDIGEGWADLVWDCTQELMGATNTLEIVQIKSKYGSLRYYADFRDPETGEHVYDLDIEDNIIRRYEKLSHTVCEDCGEEAETRAYNYWYITLCDKHHMEELERRNK